MSCRRCGKIIVLANKQMRKLKINKHETDQIRAKEEGKLALAVKVENKNMLHQGQDQMTYPTRTKQETR